MEVWRLFRSLDRVQRATFAACFLGWSLDAFDFFLLTFVIPPLAKDFNRSIAEIGYAITLTLAFRPVGALLFGILGDRFGRRIPLMIDIIFYSLIELLTAFAPNYTSFLILRALYGVGMGGEWGLGASLAMEILPAATRGLFSGILQQGYPFGYLLAAVVYGMVFPFVGWRGLFVVGALPAFLVIYIRAKVPESPSWIRDNKNATDFWGNLRTILGQHWGLFIYVILLMTAFNAMSHGTQDLYQTFLSQQRHLGVGVQSTVGIIYSLGAICGGTIVGHVSQTFGRRAAIAACSFAALLLIPVWIFSPAISLLVLGGFAMQFMVQGAWGVVPVHLNELSPAGVRGTFPGVAYQLGNLIAANTVVIQAKLAQRFGDSPGNPDYAKGMAVFVSAMLIGLIVIVLAGPEQRGRQF